MISNTFSRGSRSFDKWFRIDVQPGGQENAQQSSFTQRTKKLNSPNFLIQLELNERNKAVIKQLRFRATTCVQSMAFRGQHQAETLVHTPLLQSHQSDLKLLAFGLTGRLSSAQ